MFGTFYIFFLPRVFFFSCFFYRLLSSFASLSFPAVGFLRLVRVRGFFFLRILLGF